MTQRASIHTLGCRLNQSESVLLEEQLRGAGYTLVPFGAPADLGVIHTCTVTREADAKSRQAVRRFIRANPDAYTAVIGCYSQLGYRTLAEIEGVDLIVGNQEKLNLLHYVAQGRQNTPVVVRDTIDREDFALEVAGDAAIGRRTNLKVQDGCDFMCSFCTIPFARGRARSRDFGNLLDEARALARRGARELVLTGVNVGTYAHHDRDIADVVDALAALEGVARVRISSIEPTTVPERLLERMADPAHVLVPYLHIPLQSGSDAVLARMRRRYTAAEFRGFIEAAAERVPDLCVGTDVLVGMPGESDADFEATRSLLADSPVVYAHVFKYSARRNTPAARMPGQVAPDVMNHRSASLRALSARKRRAFNARYAGRVMEVLFEQRQENRWFGLTGNYVRVAVRSADEGMALENTLRPVLLETVAGDFMTGRLHDIPTHRQSA
jgi:threonylcarbamoyladenosine tRNA methylthiotransferase MtaB